MRIILILVSLVILLGVLLPACGDGGGVAGDGRVSVAASFDPLAAATRRVGGDAVEVHDLTPVGAEPHDVELTTDQADLMEDADLVVVLGADFQPAVEEAAERRDGPVVDVLDELDVDASGDAHVWLDPRLMAEAVRVIGDALAGADPDRAASYRRRAAEYVRDIEALDSRFEAALSRCERRTIVVPHEAFGWLAARYDLEQVALAGTDPHHESDPRRLERVARVVESQGLTTVFEDPAEPDDAVRTLARETGADVAALDSLELATARGATYVERMDANLASLAEALGCGGQ